MSKRIGLLNAEPDGTCRTIKSQYQRNSLANFVRGGGYGASAVIEIYEEDDCADKRDGRRARSDAYGGVL